MHKKINPSIEDHEHFPKCFFNFLNCALYLNRSWKTPVSGEGLSGPNRACLLRGFIAKRDYKVQSGRTRPREFAPIFAPQPHR